MSKKSVFSSSFKAGRRTYFFDVKHSPSGFYIIVSEVQTIKGKERKDRIIVFEEHIDQFIKTLEETVSELKKAKIYFHD